VSAPPRSRQEATARLAAAHVGEEEEPQDLSERAQESCDGGPAHGLQIRRERESCEAAEDEDGNRRRPSAKRADHRRDEQRRRDGSQELQRELAQTLA